MRAKWLRLLPVLAVGGCLVTGCSESTTPAEFGQYLQVAADFARQNDVAGSIDVVMTGDVGVYEKVQFGLDTGISVRAHLMFNAADEETPMTATEPDTP